MNATTKFTEAEKLRLSLTHIAGITDETCTWLVTLLSVASRSIDAEPGGRADAQRLIELALYLVQTLGNDVDCIAEGHGILVGSEVPR